MATETLILKHYPILQADRKPERTIVVEYVPGKHWRSDGSMKAYHAIVDGTLAGRVEQTIENTDRNYGRIRLPGKGRIAWAWHTADGKSQNSPGLYAATRRSAVAKLLGYDDAVKP